MKEYLLMFKNTFNYKHKSSRREFWMAVLWNIIVSTSLSLLSLPYLPDMRLVNIASTALVSLYDVIVFLPMLSLTVRRIRDVGRSPWILLWTLTWFGVFYVLYILCQPSNFRVKAWYADYDKNPDQINLEKNNQNSTMDVSSSQFSQDCKKNGDVIENAPNQNAEISQNNEYKNNQKSNIQNDSVEKIIDELNELKLQGRISDDEYQSILNSLIKK